MVDRRCRRYLPGERTGRAHTCVRLLPFGPTRLVSDVSMKLDKVVELISKGPLVDGGEIIYIRREIEEAIGQVVWPAGASEFTIHAQSGKRRGEGNGVKPIKDACMTWLHQHFSWRLETRPQIGENLGAGPIDAVRDTAQGLFALEWETGNISSSHRSLNKLALGLLQRRLAGGALIVPTRKMYQFLTDRVGNERELAPYYALWRNVGVQAGWLGIFVVEHDRESKDVPRIGKGTDGRALL